MLPQCLFFVLLSLPHLVGGLIGEQGNDIITWMNFSTHAKKSLETIIVEFKNFENVNEEFLEFRGLGEEGPFMIDDDGMKP